MATSTSTTSSAAAKKDADKDKDTTKSTSSSSTSSRSTSSSSSSSSKDPDAIKTGKDGTPTGSDGKPLEGTHSTDVRENTEDERHVQPRESGKAQVSGTEAPYTVEDSHGIERIVTPGRRNWKPRPSDPNPVLVERAKEREKAAAKAKKDRETPVGQR